MRTAYFSSWRNPGIVLRVSSNVQSGLSIARTYSATIVAMPERCWTVFRALRSAVSMARALPSSRIRFGPRSDAFAVRDQKLYSHFRIQRAKEGFGHAETGNLYRIARIHDPRKAGPGRDHAFAGNIASAAGQPFAEVFRQRIADESVEIEAGKGECAHAESSVIASDRRSRGNPARCGLLRRCAPRNDCQGRQCTKRATTSR